LNPANRGIRRGRTSTEKVSFFDPFEVSISTFPEFRCGIRSDP
jgi:hypothetical protein